jgi:hypothetical protein
MNTIMNSTMNANINNQLFFNYRNYYRLELCGGLFAKEENFKVNDLYLVIFLNDSPEIYFNFKKLNYTNEHKYNLVQFLNNKTIFKYNEDVYFQFINNNFRIYKLNQKNYDFDILTNLKLNKSEIKQFKKQFMKFYFD